MSEAKFKRKSLDVFDSTSISTNETEELERKRLIDDLAFLALCQYRNRQHASVEIELSEDGRKVVPD